GLAEMKQALALDPLSVTYNSNLIWHLYMARRYDQAIEQGRMTLDLYPNHHWAYLELGKVYEQKEMYEEALATFKKAIALHADDVPAIAELGHAYAVAGKRDEAQRVINELKQLAQQKYVSSYDRAVIYTGLGEKDQAFKWL